MDKEKTKIKAGFMLNVFMRLEDVILAEVKQPDFQFHKCREICR